MSGYLINEHGICVNPTVEKLHNEKRLRLDINYACQSTTGKWAYGYRYNCDLCPSHCGGGSLPGFDPKYREMFSEKESARISAVKSILHSIDCGKMRKDVLEELKALLIGEQLELFN